MPDLLIVIHETGNIGPADHLRAANAVPFRDSALFKVVSKREYPYAFLAQSADVFIREIQTDFLIQ